VPHALCPLSFILVSVIEIKIFLIYDNLLLSATGPVGARLSVVFQTAFVLFVTNKEMEETHEIISTKVKTG
jgi:hypothetical protein